jgi:hypothetical protein
MGTDLKLCMTDDAYATDSMLQNVMQAHVLLKKLSNNWQYRAQVKQDEFDEEALFDSSKDDFLTDLLPFKDHPLFIEATDELKKKILTCGWLAYNEKTIDIEAGVITPACMSIIHGELPALQNIMSITASQTLVDEAYHVLLVNTGSQLTRQRRGLLALTLPESNLIAKMCSFQQQHSEKWQQTLILLATAIVSEIFISDYLRLLSHEMSIQPLNRLIVDIHRRDELLHSSIFKNMAKCIYASLSIKKREFFMKILPRPVRWFANLELDVWDSMLRQIDFPNTYTLINDCRSMNEENLTRIDYSGLIALAKELESSHTRRGMDSFYSEGLIA